ncbi:hypothetical protein ISR94_00675 [Candidatus Microgenomates bacterium]|nr:hypothetical protein [Candidatus Microgenomates bacterium]
MKKSKISTILIIIATIVLAGVAIFTATRLYNLRNQAVAPNAPTSRPAAQEVSSCSLSFTISVSTSSPTATSTSSSSPTATATATSTASSTPTASPNPQCNYSCTSNVDCPSDLICYIPSGDTTGNCRNTQCTAETDCSCPQTSTATPAASDAPQLPDAGTSWPTIVGGGLGILAIFGALLLAL